MGHEVPDFVTTGSHEKVGAAIDVMQRYGISQLPVVRNDPVDSLADVVGLLQERSLLERVFKNNDALNEDVAVAMQPPLPAVDADASLDEVYEGPLGHRRGRRRERRKADRDPYALRPARVPVRAADAGRRRLDVFPARGAPGDLRCRHARREPPQPTAMSASSTIGIIASPTTGKTTRTPSTKSAARTASMMVVILDGPRRARRQTLRGLDRLGTRLRLRPRGARLTRRLSADRDVHGADDQQRAEQRERPGCSASRTTPSTIATSGFTYWWVTTSEIGATRSSQAYAVKPMIGDDHEVDPRGDRLRGEGRRAEVTPLADGERAQDEQEAAREHLVHRCHEGVARHPEPPGEERADRPRDRRGDHDREADGRRAGAEPGQHHEPEPDEAGERQSRVARATSCPEARRIRMICRARCPRSSRPRLSRSASRPRARARRRGSAGAARRRAPRSSRLVIRRLVPRSARAAARTEPATRNLLPPARSGGIVSTATWMPKYVEPHTTHTVTRAIQTCLAGAVMSMRTFGGVLLGERQW